MLTGTVASVDELLGLCATGGCKTLLVVGVDELLGSHAAAKDCEALLVVGAAAGVDQLLGWDMLLIVGAVATGVNVLQSMHVSRSPVVLSIPTLQWVLDAYTR